MLLRWALLPALCACQCLTPDDKAPATDQEARRAISVGQQQFALNMLQQVHSMQPAAGGNVIFSPFSVYQALLLAYFISANQTEESVKKVLFLNKEQDKLNTMRAYGLEKYFQTMRSVNGSTSYELSSANRLFVSQDQTVRDCMLQLFIDEIESLDYKSNPDAAAAHINAWVEQRTKNHIRDLIPSGTLSSETQLVLANAAYFKGVWKSRFQAENTHKEVFYISNFKNSLVPMMRQKGTFNHLVSEKLGAHILELPYKGDDVSMFILLPPFVSPNGIGNILKRLTYAAFLEIIDEDALISRPVEVSIPKFSNENTLELIQILESLGVGDLFTSAADLSSLTGNSGIAFSGAVHKAKIQVDEDGTVAAAATALFTFRSSRPVDPVKFTANHPFIYLLFDKPTQTILFVGIYSSPQKS